MRTRLEKENVSVGCCIKEYSSFIPIKLYLYWEEDPMLGQKRTVVAGIVFS
ncbi:hypothetical protein [Thermococcus sp. MV5]|uniref:hypothetical protein n=1 Tax=Thermococcus sp. MV5 TaxID=1638272 RepID=UPI0014395F6F|nr:hypothetical protein [Thermococcus sp. MV5]